MAVGNDSVFVAGFTLGDGRSALDDSPQAVTYIDMATTATIRAYRLIAVALSSFIAELAVCQINVTATPNDSFACNG